MEGPGTLTRWLLLAGAVVGGCAPAGGGGAGDVGGRRDASGQPCRLNSDCAPGLYCEARRCTLDCRVDRDCPRGAICESGECLSTEAPDAAPDGGLDARVPDAARVDVGPEIDGEVARDAMVARDEAVPRDESVEADAQVRPSPLGAACEGRADCDSDICLDVTVNRVQHTVCAALCCSEHDCPVGFGCLYLAGARFCMPARIYPPGFDFTASAGQRCGAGGNACRSGLCDVGRDECLGACCTDQDCRGGVCRWQIAGQSNRAICDRVPIAFGRTGDGCGNELDCTSGVCVPSPNAQPGGLPGVCGDLCCTHADCPAPYGCGQVRGPRGNVVSACVPMLRGQVQEGGACGADEACQTGLCVEGACAEPCCADVHCPPAGQACLPRFNDEGTIIRICAEP